MEVVSFVTCTFINKKPFKDTNGIWIISYFIFTFPVRAFWHLQRAFPLHSIGCCGPHLPLLPSCLLPFLIVIIAITFFSIWSSGIQGQSQGSWWQTASSFQLANRNTMGHGQFCQVATVICSCQNCSHWWFICDSIRKKTVTRLWISALLFCYRLSTYYPPIFQLA